MNLINNAPSKCSYCLELIESDDFLNCTMCKRDVHIRCLKRPGTPGDLLGDVFFDFTCCHCSGSLNEEPSTSGGTEVFVRPTLPWLIIIILAIYNLSLKSKGLSRHGYFHYKTHIISFIDKNWDYLFHPSKKRKQAKWVGSVSGALSHNSPNFFLSGQDIFLENGWWKLTYSNQTPKFCYKLCKYKILEIVELIEKLPNLDEQLIQDRQQLRNDKRAHEDINYSSDVSNSANDVERKRARREVKKSYEKLRNDKRTAEESNYSSDVSNSANDTEYKRVGRGGSGEQIDSCSRTLPYMGRKPKPIKQLNIMDDDGNKHLNTTQSSLMDFLAENLSSDDLLFNDISNTETKDDLLPLITPTDNVSFFDLVANIKSEIDYDLNESTGETVYEETILKEICDQQLKDSLNNERESSVETNDEQLYQPRIIQVTNFQKLDMKDEKNSQTKAIKEELFSDQNDSDNENQNIQRSNAVDGDINEKDEKENEEDLLTLAICEESIFTKTKRRELPWLTESTTTNIEDTCTADSTNEYTHDERLILLSEYEEKELYNKLRKIFILEQKYKLKIPSYIRRFYRKLVVREMQRTYSKPLFNLDSNKKINAQKEGIKTSILDRYQLLTNSNRCRSRSFYARIAGSFVYELFESPYTSRILHPFIYRNTKCFPHWLKLMCELQYTVNGTMPIRSTIDFCYVRPNHIAAVNALLQSEFWPGIDMSECLSYPDFSVVALYKKLVIGCAFLVPDVGFNEAYISFMVVRPNWQRSGIASFMLYHLIQTCMSKDITLHVSATNPAVCLYQKFGFKIEEVILDFYEKYLPIDSKHSRNAFFLRLMR